MIISNKLKTVLLKDLKPGKKNVKVHTQDQIDRIKKSINDAGYIQHICIGKGNEIIIGTGRFLALQQIDPNMEIEVVDLSELSPEKLKKLRIVDNQLSNISNWDKDNLTFELKSIYNDLDEGFERIIDDMGFEETFIDDLITRDESKGDPESPAEPTKDSKVKHQYTCPKCGHVWTKK